MKKRITLTMLLVSGILAMANAQKIKYKDIFAKLDKKQYEEAYPVLSAFLDGNPDHPSANLQMALLADGHLHDCETARKHYQKAKELIDKKELQRNQKYYQAYKRRDFRSGKFTIRLSDIVTDIDKRMNNCGES